MKVAIIGTGIAGSSAAYHLRESFQNARLAIDVFDEEPFQGGTIKNVIFRGGTRTQSIEPGARDFNATDDCLQNVIDETGLQRRVVTHAPNSPTWGVGNGANMTILHEHGPIPNEWENWAHLIWRYGFSASNVRTLLVQKYSQLRRLFGELECSLRFHPN